MSRHPVTALCALTLTGVVAVAGVAGAQSSGPLTAALSGKKELKGGAANGKGTFTARWQEGKLCYTLKFSGISQPLDAHIHRGDAKTDGPIVVPLKPRFTSAGAAAKCVTVKSSLRSAIRRNPGNYYANVHTQEYPAGAIRGQLKRK
jgi:hypothetical protein